MILKLKHIIIIIALFASSYHLAAQAEAIEYAKPYAISAGAKIGNLFQLDYKQFVTPEVGLNFSYGAYLIDWDGTFLSLVLSYHHDTNAENLFWYYGGGIAGRLASFESQIGMATVLGIEGVTRDKILNFFVDIQPTAYVKNRQLFSTVGGFGGFGRGLALDYTVAATVGVRYILKKK